MELPLCGKAMAVVDEWRNGLETASTKEDKGLKI